MNSNLEKLIMGVQLLALGGILSACGKGGYDTDALKDVGTPSEVVSEASESDADNAMQEGEMSQADADMIQEGGMSQADADMTQEGGMMYQVDGQVVTQETVGEDGTQGGIPDGQSHNSQKGEDAYGTDNGEAQGGGEKSEAARAELKQVVSQILDGSIDMGGAESVSAGSQSR